MRKVPNQLWGKRGEKEGETFDIWGNMKGRVIKPVKEGVLRGEIECCKGKGEVGCLKGGKGVKIRGGKAVIWNN